MKAFKNKLIYLITTLLMAGSCSEDYLVVENKNALLDTNYETMEGLRKYENGMFSINRGPYDYFYTCYGSALTTEYFFHFTGGEGQTIREWSDLNPKPTNEFAGFIYGTFYNTIRMANIILELAASKKGDIADADPEELNRITGTAYFMRALCHFQIMAWWGKSFEPDDKWGIVIQTKPVVERKDFQIPRSKPSEVYAQIISDFQKAKELLPLESELPTSMLGHPTRGAATAFLGKMYLVRKNYQAAKEEFDEFFSENPSKRLLSYFGDNFHGMYENGIESIFEIQNSDVIVLTDTWGGGAGRPYQAFLGPPFLGRGNVRIPEVFMDRYEKNDFRKIETAFSRDIDTLYKPDGTMVIHIDSTSQTGTTKRYTTTPAVKYGPKKYINKARDMVNSQGLGQHVCNENEIIMRVAEVYCMYAEVLAETGNLTQAYEYLNKVRRRAFGYDPGVFSTSPYDFPVVDKSDFYKKLQSEFGKEFLGENLLWFNWLRWGIVEEEVAKTDRTFIRGIHEAMPIPEGELRTDQLVVQNPGY